MHFFRPHGDRGGATIAGPRISPWSSKAEHGDGYLFVIAMVSMRLGYRLAILAAIASVLCFD
jgi:hypothetical protein